MSRDFLVENDQMETMLLSHGIPRHLGWTHLSQIADWVVQSYVAADRSHSKKLQATQGFLDELEALPPGRRPLNQIYGLTWDQAVRQSSLDAHWQTTLERFTLRHHSLEFTRAIRDHLASIREQPEMPNPQGVEDGDFLWLVICPSSVLLASVPTESEVNWTSEIRETMQMRCYPLPFTGLASNRTHHQPDIVSITDVWMIDPQHQDWAKQNLAGAAILGDLVIPATDPIPAIA